MTISCIIPAYNEAARIAAVINVANSYPGFKEVIVVDDGSTDNTTAVARACNPTRVVSLHENRGKAGAVLEAFKYATGELIVLLDSDLVGLTKRHLHRLVRPALDGETMSLSLRSNSWPPFKFNGIDPWSGERAFPRWVLEEVAKMPHLEVGYILEACITDVAIKHQLMFVSVPWPEVKLTTKIQKEHNVVTGVTKELKMFFQIYSTFGGGKTMYQHAYLPYHLWRSKVVSKMSESKAAYLTAFEKLVGKDH